jgi:hypothetical protein
MTDEIELTEAWVNLDYSTNMNRFAPDLNAASPGRPYFVGVEGAVPGQWVRIVCRMSDGAVFWCVADFVEVLDGAIRVTAVLYEAGDPAPRWFLDGRWGARLELRADGNWYVVELAEE